MLSKRLLGWVISVSVCGFSIPAWSVDHYTVHSIDLPEVQGCTTLRGNDAGFHLNDLGQVIGPLKSCAFFWDKGIVTLLGSQHTNLETRATALNNKGQVVFNSTEYDAQGKAQKTYAYLWHQGKTSDLGALGSVGEQRSTTALDINESGQVVGFSALYDNTDIAKNHAFLWQRNRLIDLVAGTAYANQSSSAEAINDKAQVVINSTIDLQPVPVMDTINNSLSIFKPDYSETSRPLLWQNGILAELAYRTFSPGPYEHSQPFVFNGVDYGNINTLYVNNLYFGYAFTINNSGIILGRLRKYGLADDGRYFDTTLWQPDGNFQIVGNGLTYAGILPHDIKINNANQMVKILRNGNLDTKTLLVSLDGISFQPILTTGVWTSSTNFSYTDINDKGQVVWSGVYVENGQYMPSAFIYQDNTVYSLNDLIPRDSGLHVQNIYAINNPGQVLVGTDKGIAVLNPIVNASCDANQDNKIDKTDLTTMLTANRTANPAYDLDGDGMVTIKDLRKCVLQCSKKNCAA